MEFFKKNFIKKFNCSDKLFEHLLDRVANKKNSHKLSEMEKSKNVREQRRRIFGESGEPNPDRKASKQFYEKQAQALNRLSEKRYGMPISPATGKFQYTLRDINKMRAKQGKAPITIEEARNHPDYEVANPKVTTADAEMIRLREQKSNPKPDWRSGQFQAQRHIGAKAHEMGHLEISPEGKPIGDLQTVMDEGSSIAGSKYQGMPKQTEYEVQPMAAEEAIRRRAGIPQFNRPQYGDPRRGHATEELTEQSPERVTLDTGRKYGKRLKDKEGKLYDLVGMSSNLSEENRQRMRDIDEGILTFHPEHGWQQSQSPDALINLRAQGRGEEARQRLQQKFPPVPRKLAASEDHKLQKNNIKQKHVTHVSKDPHLSSKFPKISRIESSYIPGDKTEPTKMFVTAFDHKNKPVSSLHFDNPMYRYLEPRGFNKGNDLHRLMITHVVQHTKKDFFSPYDDEDSDYNLMDVHDADMDGDIFEQRPIGFSSGRPNRFPSHDETKYWMGEFFPKKGVRGAKSSPMSRVKNVESPQKGVFLTNMDRKWGPEDGNSYARSYINPIHSGKVKSYLNYQEDKNPVSRFFREVFSGQKIDQGRYHVDNARDKHRQKLAEIKAMPKPNLPKSEEMSEEDTHSKGVHKPAFGADSGTSEAGAELNIYNMSPNANWENKSKAKQAHKKVISELKRQPIAKLPKSESGWKITEKSEEFEKASEGMDKRCWEGYEPVPGKKAYSKGSCRKIAKSKTLEHYSPQENLKEIDPSKARTGVDARAKHHQTEHPHSFYYTAGATPEDEVKGVARSKYTIQLPEHASIYDLSTDPQGIVSEAIQQNNGALNMDMVHAKLKEAGHHGFMVSGHPVERMRTVVGLYHSQPVKEEEKL